MTERTKEFIKLTDEMIRIQGKKGLDYGEETDGLRNLRRRGPAGVLARMGDKMSRLESLTQPGRIVQVLDESVEDTLLDLANYCLLLIILRRDLHQDLCTGYGEGNHHPGCPQWGGKP